MCWGTPTILTVATAIIEFMPEGFLIEGTLVPGLGLDKCFFSSYSAQVSLWNDGEISNVKIVDAKVAFFHGPLAALLIFNLTLFLSSAYSLLFGIWAVPREDTNANSRGSRQMFWIVLELFLVLGLTWLADIISLSLNWAYGSVYVGYEVLFFDAFNALQGFFIFLVLVCKSRMRSLIRSAQSHWIHFKSSIITVLFCRRSLAEACSTALNCLPRTSEKDRLKVLCLTV